MNRTAMIVDDSRAMRLVMGRFLKALGYSVTEAGDGREALTKLQGCAEPFDFALVDWNMPEMDGISLVRALRQDPRLHDLRVMMVTSEAEGDRVSTALEAGADEYLMKPFTMESLADKLAVLGF